MEARISGNIHPRIAVPKSSKRYTALASILRPIQQSRKDKPKKNRFLGKRCTISGKTLLEAYKENEQLHMAQDLPKYAAKDKRTHSTYGTVTTPPNEQQDMLVTFGSSNFFSRPPLISINRGKSLSTCSQGQLECCYNLKKPVVLPTLLKTCEPEEAAYAIELPNSRKRLVSKLKDLFC